MRSYWIRVGPTPVTDVLIRKGEGTQREGDHMKTEAELGAMQL
jgi:hypothetical protein